MGTGSSKAGGLDVPEAVMSSPEPADKGLTRRDINHSKKSSHNRSSNKTDQREDPQWAISVLDAKL
jgi:hypothetical protein